MSDALPPVQSLEDSIDGVIGTLTRVIDWSRDSRSRLGYFAALYRRVTVQVRDGIGKGQFENGARMEQFDVIFANRYLQALLDLRNGAAPSKVWAYAFDSAQTYWPIVLQHLLIGINAHINLDLGIAAAQTMRGRSIEELHADFNRINAVLASLVNDVQNELASVWMLLRLFNSTLGSVNDALIKFSLNEARNEAWRSAQRFAIMPDSEWPAAIRSQDEKMLFLAQLVGHPGELIGAATRVVRLGEVQDVSKVIAMLA